MRARGWLWGGLVVALAAGTAVASTVIGLSVEDQARLARFVVVGEVVAQRGVQHPDQGLETAVTLRVVDVLKGDARPGRELVFHTRGGELDGEVSEAVGEAVFHPGQRVLVFIEEVGGRLYNMGLSMGVWDVHEGRGGETFFTRALRDDLHVIGEEAVEPGPLTFSDMRGRVAYAARNPRFDNEMLRARAGQGK